MRWLVLTDDHLPAPGGVAVWTDRVVQGLRRAGHDVQVFARQRPGLPADVVGVQWPSFGMHGGVGLGLAAWGVRADRVLCTTWTAVPPGWRDVDVVVHGSDVTRPTRRPARRRRVLARSRVWAVSAAMAREVERLGARAVVLPSPVAIAPAPPEVPGPWWTWAGRAVPGKGGDRVVRLVAAAGAQGRFVGTGPCLPRWAVLARQLQASVRFDGLRTPAQTLAALRASALVLMLPQEAGATHGAEGLGLVALEAAGQGVPVVGCGVGGVPEAIGPGLLLPTPDDVPASVAAIRAWWRPDRGQQAWAWVQQVHGTDRTVASLVGGR